MQVDSVVTVVVGLIAAAGIVIGALVSRLGEPRRLRMLSLLNHVIREYDAGKSDDGRAKLIDARRDLARRTAKHLVSEPPYLRFITATTTVLVVVSGGLLFAWIASDAFNAPIAGPLLISLLGSACLAVLCGALQWFLRRMWSGYVPVGK